MRVHGQQSALRKFRPLQRRETRQIVPRAHTVEVRQLDGSVESVTVEEGETILEAMLEAGLEPTHDCRMGVCMTCPARVVSGTVDQGNAMLSEDVREKGYALMCMAHPESDCVVQEITEAEILDEQLCA